MKLLCIVFMALLASVAFANDILDYPPQRQLKMGKKSKGMNSMKSMKGGKGMNSMMSMKSTKRTAAPTAAPTATPSLSAVLSFTVVFDSTMPNSAVREAVISTLSSKLSGGRRRRLDADFLDAFFGQWELLVSRFKCDNALCLLVNLLALKIDGYEEVAGDDTEFLDEMIIDLVLNLNDIGDLASTEILDETNNNLVVFPPITAAPSSDPSIAPTGSPSSDPSIAPTGSPSIAPSGSPSSMPSPWVNTTLVNTTRYRLLESGGRYLTFDDHDEDDNESEEEQRLVFV